MDAPKIAQCMIKWKDTGRTQDVDICLDPFCGRPKFIDNRIFYYCNGEEGFKLLLGKENGEDFQILGYSFNTLF